MKRRKFIYSSAFASCLLAHNALGFSLSQSQNTKTSASQPLIARLGLVTSCPINTLANFYGETLGLDIIYCSDLELSILAGKTIIDFHLTNVSPAPFYHFAFNIPENKIEQALLWQRTRTEIISTPRQLMDDNYSDDVRHFRHWNAHSIFFHDPAGNLLEYIARHDLNNAESGSFSSKDILCASEIALLVDDAPHTAANLNKILNLEDYKNTSEFFKPIGDENGLLLVMKNGRSWKRHTENPIFPLAHKTTIHLSKSQSMLHQIESLPYTIHY